MIESIKQGMVIRMFFEEFVLSMAMGFIAAGLFAVLFIATKNWVGRFR